MSSKQIPFIQILKDFDNIEQKLLQNPQDKSLLVFLDSVYTLIHSNIYCEEQLKEIRNKMLTIQRTLKIVRSTLRQRHSYMLEKYIRISQYIKVSYIHQLQSHGYGITNYF